MKFLKNNPFVWFVCLVMVMNLVAWWILPYRKQPPAVEVYRNPLLMRGYPEYVRGDHPWGKKLVVIISNSQAVGKEIPAGKIYFALLRKELEKRGVPVQIENWSSGGIRTTDIELLTIQALERKVDLLIFVLGSSNFDMPSKLKLDYSSLDISLLAGKPSLWPYLKETTFWKNTTYHDILKRFFMLHSSLLRARIPVTDIMARITPKVWHKYFFGTVRKTRKAERLDDPRSVTEWKEPKKEEYIVKRKKYKGLSLGKDQLIQRLETFRLFYQLFEKRLKTRKVRVVWIWMPYAVEVFPKRALQTVRLFNQRASTMIAESGVRCVDFTDSIPTDDYMTLSHFDESGHKKFAKQMVQILTDELQ